MSSPTEPKRRRLDENSTASAGVSFVAQDVPENEPSKSKVEPADGDGANEGADLHAQLKASVERRRGAQADLKALHSKELEAKNRLDRQASDEMRELQRKHDEELRQLQAKHETDRAEHGRFWTSKFEHGDANLEKRKATEMTIRSAIRERGQIESDSLLIVGNDGIAAILPFLTVPELGRCEMTCRALKMLSQGSVHWEYLEKNQPVMMRSSACSARIRVVRYHEASKFAEQLEPLLKNHQTESSRRCKACSTFPSKLLLDPSPADYEVFVRFSAETPSSCILVLEGFADYRLFNVPEPFSIFYSSSLTFNFDAFDLSSWPSMERVFRLNGGKDNAGWENCVRDALKDLTATIIAVEKSTSKAHLVVGSAEFEHEEEDVNGKITFYGIDDMAVCPHKYYDCEKEACIAFKWDDDRDTDRKFECHVVVSR